MAHYEFFLASSLEKVFADERPIQMTKNKLTGFARIDERFLTFCLYLNLSGSSITTLNTDYL